MCIVPGQQLQLRLRMCNHSKQPQRGQGWRVLGTLLVKRMSPSKTRSYHNTIFIRPQGGCPVPVREMTSKRGTDPPTPHRQSLRDARVVERLASPRQMRLGHRQSVIITAAIARTKSTAMRGRATTIVRRKWCMGRHRAALKELQEALDQLRRSPLTPQRWPRRFIATSVPRRFGRDRS